MMIKVISALWWAVLGGLPFIQLASEIRGYTAVGGEYIIALALGWAGWVLGGALESMVKGE